MPDVKCVLIHDNFQNFKSYTTSITVARGWKCIKKVEKIDSILVDKVIGGLKMVDGKHMVESASAEFMSFVEDADQCLWATEK